MVEIKRGDIFLVDLNPIIGTEQSGIRPVVVVQIDKANKVSPHTIIVPMTTKIREAILSSHVFIKSIDNGLSSDSVILCEQIRVIDKKRIIKFLGRLNNIQIFQLNKALTIILEL